MVCSIKVRRLLCLLKQSSLEKMTLFIDANSVDIYIYIFHVVLAHAHTFEERKKLQEEDKTNGAETVSFLSICLVSE